MDSGNTVDLSDSDLALLESLVQYFDNEMEAVEEHAIRYNGKITFFLVSYRLADQFLCYFVAQTFSVVLLTHDSIT